MNDVVKNKVQIVGNLGKPPELKTFDSGSRVAEVNVAVSQGKNKKTDEWNPSTWITIKAWNDAADSLMQFDKGDRVAITESKLSHDEWERDGKKQTKLYLTVFALEAATSNNGGDYTQDAEQVAVASPTTIVKPSAALLKAIANAEDDAALDAVKEKALAKGIAFESFKAEYDAKALELIPF
ncbi:MAG: single-stranded DNA-binding protein [Nodosilinea sp. WJT8-NPBG4]|jgi:single-strand DNA-binding protein|nr:single-stranded DNA-binding protein [Nodosilinea sp. WJT8-NPBG4]